MDFSSVIHATLQLSDFDDQTAAVNLFELAASVFSLILFSLTLYAWSKRGRQPTLFIVSIAFLLFFGKELVELLPISDLHGDIVSASLDFVVLGLFFLALVVRPRRKEAVKMEQKGGMEHSVTGNNNSP